MPSYSDFLSTGLRTNDEIEFTCDVCHTRVRTQTRDYYQLVGLGIVCAHCAETEQFSQCDCCGNHMLKKDCTVLHGHDYCPHCMSQASTCEHCHEKTFNTVMILSRASSVPLCHECADRLTKQCSVCGGRYFKREMSRCEHCDNFICPSCACDCMDTACGRGELGAFKYSKRHPDPKIRICPEHGEIVSIPTAVGVEIEAENINGHGENINTRIPSECGIIGDGSLTCGVEIQTPPRTGKELETVIKRTCRALKKAGFEIRNSCGLHIHLNAKKLNAKTVRNFTALQLLLEDYIFECLPSGRRKNRYCRKIGEQFDLDAVLAWKTIPDCERFFYHSQTFSAFLRKNKYPWYDIPALHAKILKDCYDVRTKTSYKALWKKHYRKFTREAKEDHYNEKRYSSLNLHSFFAHQTIELRQHHGSLEPSEIFFWIEFNLRVLELAKKITIQDIRHIASFKRARRYLIVAKLAEFPKPLLKHLAAQHHKFTPEKLPEPTPKKAPKKDRQTQDLENGILPAPLPRPNPDDYVQRILAESERVFAPRYIETDPHGSSWGVANGSIAEEAIQSARRDIRLDGGVMRAAAGNFLMNEDGTYRISQMPF